MQLFSRREVVGIGTSILVLILALLGVRFFITDSPGAVATPEDSEPTVVSDVVVADASVTDPESALAFAIVEASDSQGRLQRLVVQDVLVGEGRTARPGDTLTLHYIGSVKDGVQFENTYHSVPFTFRLGTGEVIEGWDRGLVGMREGGQRILVVPASLAYGNRTVGSVPGGATLIFALELLSLE